MTAWRNDTVPHEHLSRDFVNASDSLLLNGVCPSFHDPWALKIGPLPRCYPLIVAVLASFIWSPGSCPLGPAGSLWHPESHTWAEHLPGFCALWHETSAGIWRAHKTPGDSKRKESQRRFLQEVVGLLSCSAVLKKITQTFNNTRISCSTAACVSGLCVVMSV